MLRSIGCCDQLGLPNLTGIGSTCPSKAKGGQNRSFCDDSRPIRPRSRPGTTTAQQAPNPGQVEDPSETPKTLPTPVKTFPPSRTRPRGSAYLLSSFSRVSWSFQMDSWSISVYLILRCVRPSVVALVPSRDGVRSASDLLRHGPGRCSGVAGGRTIASSLVFPSVDLAETAKVAPSSQHSQSVDSITLLPVPARG